MISTGQPALAVLDRSEDRLVNTANFLMYFVDRNALDKGGRAGSVPSSSQLVSKGQGTPDAPNQLNRQLNYGSAAV